MSKTFLLVPENEYLDLTKKSDENLLDYNEKRIDTVLKDKKLNDYEKNFYFNELLRSYLKQKREIDEKPLPVKLSDNRENEQVFALSNKTLESEENMNELPENISIISKSTPKTNFHTPNKSHNTPKSISHASKIMFDTPKSISDASEIILDIPKSTPEVQKIAPEVPKTILPDYKNALKIINENKEKLGISGNGIRKNFTHPNIYQGSNYLNSLNFIYNKGQFKKTPAGTQAFKERLLSLIKPQTGGFKPSLWRSF